MAHLDQRLRRGNDDSQLLEQFARQRNLDMFARLDLAARKFPQSALVLVQRALGDQYTSVSTANDGRSNMDPFHFRTSCRALWCQRWKAGHRWIVST